MKGLRTENHDEMRNSDPTICAAGKDFQMRANAFLLPLRLGERSFHQDQRNAGESRNAAAVAGR